MKKKLVLALLMATLLAGGAFAKEWYNSYAPGIDGSNILANVGIGIGYGGIGYKMSIPPISASVEYAGLPIPLSVGAYFGIARYKWEGVSLFWGDTYSYTRLFLAFGARAAWHFNFLQNLDTYAGLGLGYIMYSYGGNASYLNDLGLSKGAFDFGAFIGARYFFTNIIGVYLETGYSGLTFVSAGLSLKF